MVVGESVCVYMHMGHTCIHICVCIYRNHVFRHVCTRICIRMQIWDHCFWGLVETCEDPGSDFEQSQRHGKIRGSFIRNTEERNSDPVLEAVHT